MSTRPRPILYIAFANDLENPARSLSGLTLEAANIQSALTGPDGPWQILIEPACTSEKLVTAFATNQVTIFHYAGHADPDVMLLQTDAGGNQHASSLKLEDFLAQQPSLRLVFLNACSTRDWAQRLVTLGIPSVVATTRAVPDATAPLFAKLFYTALADGRSIAESFATATKGVDLTDAIPPAQDTTRSIHVVGAPDLGWNGLPWAIFPPPTTLQPTPNDPALWTLATGANDPLIGVPPLPPTYYENLPPSPYVSLQGHQPKDAAIFFGRSGEIRALYDWVTTPQTPILLFYGQSGVGKSSLLNAGLIPRLPAAITLHSRRRTQSLLADLHDEIGGPTDAAAIAWLTAKVPNLLILDQVEEEITQNLANSAAIAPFLNRLTHIFSLVDPEKRTARLILSFRKEYLAEIRNGLAESTTLLTDFWLQRLDHDNILQVILGPIRSQPLRDKYKLTIPPEDHEQDLPTRIANDLDRDPHAPIATILQILLNKLWTAALDQARQQNTNPAYTTPLYLTVASSNPLKDFYDQEIQRLGPTIAGTEIDHGLELDLLYEHTTPLVTSRNRSLTDLQLCYPHIPNLPAILTANLGHLLTESPSSDTPPIPTSSLVHDTLAPVIRREFELSLTPGARARRILENRARDWADPKKPGDTLDAADLKVVQNGLSQMRSPNPVESALIKISKKRVRRTRTRQGAVLALFLAVVFVLLVGESATTINSLLSGATLVEPSDPFAGDIRYLAAASRFETSWLMDLSLHPTLHVQLQSGVDGALKAAEIDRITDSVPLQFTGACAYALSPQHDLLYQTRGALNTWQPQLAGAPLPDQLTQANPLGACDPQTHTIVTIDSDGPALWLAGQRTPLPLPPGAITTLPTPGEDCAAEIARARQLAAVANKLAGTQQDPEARAEIEKFKATCKATEDGAGVLSVTLAPGATRLALLQSTGAIQVIDRPTNTLITIPAADPGDPITKPPIFSPDGNLLAQADPKKFLIRLWDVTPSGHGRLAATIPDADQVAFGGTAEHPLVASGGRPGMHLFSLDDLHGAPLKPTGTAFGTVRVAALAVSPDGTMAALSGEDGQVRIAQIPPQLNFDENNEGHGLLKLDKGWEMLSFPLGDGVPTHMAFSPDSKFLVTAAQRDHATHIATWELGARTTALFSNLAQDTTTQCQRVQTYITRNTQNPTPDIQDFDYTTLQTSCNKLLKSK
jgi:hypothetical protein